MNQLTKIKHFRVSKDESHYLDVLHDVYKIKASSFIRDAIIEKLKRDIPKLREAYKHKDDFVCPF